MPRKLLKRKAKEEKVIEPEIIDEAKTEEEGIIQEEKIIKEDFIPEEEFPEEDVIVEEPIEEIKEEPLDLGEPSICRVLFATPTRFKILKNGVVYEIKEKNSFVRGEEIIR